MSHNLIVHLVNECVYACFILAQFFFRPLWSTLFRRDSHLTGQMDGCWIAQTLICMPEQFDGSRFHHRTLLVYKAWNMSKHSSDWQITSSHCECKEFARRVESKYLRQKWMSPHPTATGGLLMRLFQVHLFIEAKHLIRNIIETLWLWFWVVWDESAF